MFVPPSSAPSPGGTSSGSVSLEQLSSDQFSNTGSQHATEVEPHAITNGQMIVSAFQVGRIFGGGAAGIGFATSASGGATWTNGILPGITVFSQAGSYLAATDPSVAFDARHGVWMISTLGLNSASETVLVSRSRDGVIWENPVTVSTTVHADKNWVACDNTSTSPFYGNCYTEWDDPSDGNGVIWMSTSSDGGLTWLPALTTADRLAGIGGQIVVQPSGKVVVVIDDDIPSRILAFSSANGGASWSSSGLVSSIVDHQVAGGMRTISLPSAQIASDGRIFVVWQDCRFRTGCLANDIVISSSIDGVTWTAPARIPIDDVTGTSDHFIPALALDASSSGSQTRLALSYYYYSNAGCAASTCQLFAGFTSSADAGQHWTTPATLAGPMFLSWLPDTVSGRMVGDYSALVYSAGRSFPIFSRALANQGSTLNQAIYTAMSGISGASAQQQTLASPQDVVTFHADHAPRRFADFEHRFVRHDPLFAPKE